MNDHHNINFVIDVSFECESCGEPITDKVSLPEPDFNVFEDGGDDYSWSSVFCEMCGHENNVDIYCNFKSHSFSVSHNNSEVSDGIPYYDDYETTDELDWLVENKDSYLIFIKQLENAESIDKIRLENKHIEHSMHVMNYAYVVSAIEGYIGSTFINFIFTHDKIFKEFILKNTDFKDLKFDAVKLIEDPNVLNKHVANYLDNFIFHKMEKVKPLFKSVLGYDFGDIHWLFKAIKLRHDCVHRAGITKDGKKLEFAEEDIAILISNSRQMAVDLEKRLSDLKNEISKNS